MRVKDPAKIASIHEATLKLALLGGIDGLNMAAIAKMAKMATGTLYVYFEDKEALLAHLFDVVKTNCRNHLPSNEPENEPFRMVFKKGFLSALHYWVTAYPEATFMDQYKHSSFIPQSSRNSPLPMEQYFSLLLKGAKKQLLVKDLETDLLLCAITGLLRQTAMYCNRQNKKLTKQFEEKVFTLCWDAIKA